MSFKKNIALLFLLIAGFTQVRAQSILTIAPDTNGKDVTLLGWAPNNNFGISEWFVGDAWTWQGTPGVERSLMEFSLSQLPANAVVLNATLKLFGDSNQWGGNSQLSGNNEALISRITSPWAEHSVNWNTQPSFTTAGEAYIPGATAIVQNREVNVTQMVNDALSGNQQEVGFMIRLLNENYYRRVVFGSFDNPNMNRRPKLEITYVTGVSLNCVTYKMNPSGKDAGVISKDPNITHPDDYSFQGTSWTYSGTPGTSRAFMEFDFSAIPAGAVLTKGALSLFCNSASWAKHSQMSGSNKAFLQRTTSAWTEAGITWNNQPTTTTQNQTVLSPSLSDVQNYPDVNILPIIIDGLSGAQTSVGFMIRLETEQYYRAMHFLSGDNGDSTKWPVLNVCYVMPKITVTSANGGETWMRNNSYNITWTSTLVDTVNIMYSSDSGVTWNVIANNVAASAGTYAWTPVSAAGNNYLVKVVNKKYNNIYDQSNAVFTVRNEPQITVVTPNGGEVWLAGETKNITWTSSYSDSVKLEYTTDGNNWNIMASSVSSSTGSYAWNLPSVSSTTVKVRVTDVSYPAYSDMSNTNFTIRPAPSVVVTAPNGGELWYNNTSQNITWTSSNSANVKIEYSHDNGTSWNSIASSVASSAGTYNWTLPSIQSSQMLIKISDVDFPDYKDQSNAVFTIAAPSVTVTSPNGGEIWVHSSQQSITWNSAGVNAVNLEFSSDGGNTWTTIASNVSGNSFTWSLPATQTTSAKVRITDSGTSTATDMSDAVFTITAGVGIALIETGDVCIFPNPSNGNFTLVFSTAARREVYITDVQGRIVSVIRMEKQQGEINLGSLAKGIYFLNAEGFRNKLIIQ